MCGDTQVKASLLCRNSWTSCTSISSYSAKLTVQPTSSQHLGHGAMRLKMGMTLAVQGAIPPSCAMASSETQGVLDKLHHNVMLSI
jgi:hypothetical protein